MARKQAANSGAPGNGDANVPPAAYFLSLSLANVRCFGEPAQMLDLSDGKGRPARWTILIGENGTGKTTILQSLASCEPERPPRSQGGNPPEQDYPGPRLTITFLPDVWRSEGNVPNFRVRIASGPPLSEAGVNYREGELTFKIRDTRGLVSWEEATMGRNALRCYGYGASRRLSSAVLSEPTQDDPVGSLFSDDFHLLVLSATCSQFPPAN